MDDGYFAPWDWGVGVVGNFGLVPLQPNFVVRFYLLGGMCFDHGVGVTHQISVPL